MPWFCYIMTHEKRSPMRFIVLSALMPPRIFLGTAISPRPRSAALLVGGILGSRTNLNRPGSALHISHETAEGGNIHVFTDQPLYAPDKLPQYFLAPSRRYALFYRVTCVIKSR